MIAYVRMRGVKVTECSQLAAGRTQLPREESRKAPGEARSGEGGSSIQKMKMSGGESDVRV